MNINDYIKGALIVRNLMFTYYHNNVDISVGQVFAALSHSVSLSKEESDEAVAAINKVVVDYFKNQPSGESWTLGDYLPKE